MGLNIREIIPRKEIEITDLKRKTLCVDAFNILYQFLSTIRQVDGTPLMDKKQRITSHLSGLFYRNIRLLAEGMNLIYIFDGEAPELKEKTHKRRSEGRNLAKEKFETAKDREDFESMRRYSSQFVRLNDEMIEESKNLLKAMGIAIIQAPGEGEAEMAYICRAKNIDGCVSQDYDSLLFGAKKLIRNLALTGKKRNYSGFIEVRPEEIELEKVLNYLDLNIDQLICLGILVGTDYNPKGIPGIGQKKALEIVKKYKQPIFIFKSVEEQIYSLPEEDRFDWKEIFELFKKPNVVDKEIEFQKINEQKIKEILVEEHDFSEERVEKQLAKLREFESRRKQKGLNEWV
jgi:flap endonuclease-1